MKATAEQLTKLLKAIGLNDVEVVEDDTAADFDQSAAIERIDTERSKILSPRIEEQLAEKAFSDAAGKFGGKIRSALAKSSGMSHNALAKITDDTEAILAAFTHYKGSIEGEQGDVKKRIEEIIAENERQRNELKTEYENKLTAERDIRLSRDMMEFIESNVLKDAPLLPGANKKVLAQDILGHYKNTFALSFDEAEKKLSFNEKDKPNMPALNNNLPVNPVDIAKSFLSDRGIWQTDTRNMNAAQQMNNHAANNGIQNNYTAPKVEPSGDKVADLNTAMKGFFQNQGLPA